LVLHGLVHGCARQARRCASPRWARLVGLTRSPPRTPCTIPGSLMQVRSRRPGRGVRSGNTSGTALYRGSGRLFRPRPGRLERTRINEGAWSPVRERRFSRLPPARVPCPWPHNVGHLRRNRGQHSCRVISLIAGGSSGRRSPLPQPVPLTTYVVEYSLGAAEVRGDPRPIAWTIFEDTGSDQLLLDLGRIGASALSAEEVGGCLDYCVHPLVSSCEWGRSVDRLLLRSWFTSRSLRSKRRRY